MCSWNSNAVCLTYRPKKPRKPRQNFKTNTLRSHEKQFSKNRQIYTSVRVKHFETNSLSEKSKESWPKSNRFYVDKQISKFLVSFDSFDFDDAPESRCSINTLVWWFFQYRVIVHEYERGIEKQEDRELLWQSAAGHPSARFGLHGPNHWTDLSNI